MLFLEFFIDKAVEWFCEEPTYFSCLSSCFTLSVVPTGHWLQKAIVAPILSSLIINSAILENPRFPTEHPSIFGFQVPREGHVQISTFFTTKYGHLVELWWIYSFGSKAQGISDNIIFEVVTFGKSNVPLKILSLLSFIMQLEMAIFFNVAAG